VVSLGLTFTRRVAFVAAADNFDPDTTRIANVLQGRTRGKYLRRCLQDIRKPTQAVLARP